MSKKAFTLIELLVVIAIVGLMASIVLLNMQNTRFKAHDAQIQSFLHQLRNAAEMSYVSNGDSYSLVCDEADDTLNNSGEIGVLEMAIKKENNNQDVACFESADGREFAASSPLRARLNKYWCVQAAGLSLEINNPVNSATCQ